MSERFLGGLAAAGLMLSASAAAAAGFDQSFGTDGVLPVPLSADGNDRYISVKHGPDGLIYAAGFTSAEGDSRFAVSRFTAEGVADAGFGDGGTAAVNLAEGGKAAEVARGLVVQADGKVLVAGPFEHDPGAEGDAGKDLDVGVVRLGPDGRMDASFGTGGVVRIDLGAGKPDGESLLTDNAWGLVARPGGGYAVFAVTPSADAAELDFVVIGLTDAGAPDPAFGTGGRAVFDVDGSASARNIAVQPDGKLVATGYRHAEDGVVSPVLIRLAADGTPDAGFGTGGVATSVILPSVTESYQVGLQGDGYVLAGYGRAAPDATLDMVVYRFLADGSRDTGFGTDGVTLVNLADQDDRARNLAILPDGRILLVGSGKLDADDVDALVVLLDPDGAPDAGFGDGGHLLVDLGGPADAFFGLSVAPDGSSATLAGFKGAASDGPGNDDAVLARIGL